MRNPIRCLTIGAILMAVSVANAGNPGTQWRITVSVSASGMSSPAHVSEMCVTGGGQDQPAPPSGQNDCKYTELARSADTVRYAIECKAMKGTGQMTYSADHYLGKFDLQGEHGPVSSTYEGQKLGTCNSAQANSGALSNAGAANSSAAASSVGVAAVAGNALSTAGSETKDAVKDVATDTAQSAQDDAKQAVKDKATSVLKGLFGR